MALLASAATHAIVLAAALVGLQRHPLPVPTENSTIEMVMLRQKGTEPAPPNPTVVKPADVATPPPPGQQAKTPAAASQPTLAVPPQKEATETAPTLSAPSGMSPEKPVEPAQQQPASKLDFAGFDDFNAEAFGNNVVPAAPDSRLRNDPPDYPHEAALRGEHGTVVLLIHVSEAGQTAGADILQSSGFASLDNAALAAVRRWHFKPALHEGQPVRSDMPFRFVFEEN